MSNITNAPVYTVEEFKGILPICDELKLTSTKKLIEHLKFDPEDFKTCLDFINQGKAKWVEKDLEFEGFTETSKKFYKALYDLIFDTEKYHLPEHINADPKLLPFVQWRCDLGK